MEQKTKSGTAVSVVTLVGALIIGELALIVVPVLVKATHLPTALQWLIVIAVIAIGGYLLFGWPQIVAWEKGNGQMVVKDPRARWALPLMKRGGGVMFVVASLIGGSWLIGWWLGRSSHPKARSLTFVGALIFAAFWGAFYLGLLSVVTHLV